MFVPVSSSVFLDSGLIAIKQMTCYVHMLLWVILDRFEANLNDFHKKLDIHL